MGTEVVSYTFAASNDGKVFTFGIFVAIQKLIESYRRPSKNVGEAYRQT